MTPFYVCEVESVGINIMTKSLHCGNIYRGSNRPGTVSRHASLSERISSAQQGLMLIQSEGEGDGYREIGEQNGIERE